jgi:hypothetical protein
MYCWSGLIGGPGQVHWFEPSVATGRAYSTVTAGQAYSCNSSDILFNGLTAG